MKLSGLRQRQSMQHGLLALLMGIAVLFSMLLPPVHSVSAAAGTNTLYAHERLYGGQSLFSANRSFELIMQTDGNLVIYGPGHVALWSSNTAGRAGAWLGNQGDGNLVVYLGGTALWASTTGAGPSNLIMQDDGNLVLYKNGGGATWASNTASSGSDKLTDSQARQMLASAGIATRSSGNCSNRNKSSCTSLEQVRRRTINGIIAFKHASGCTVTITAGTETGHSSGTYSHWNGYKVDIDPDCVTGYITGHYQKIGDRSSDGAPQYKSGTGDIYAYEYKKNHWDILYY